MSLKFTVGHAARRLIVFADEPSPTVAANGLANVVFFQYEIRVRDIGMVRHRQDIGGARRAKISAGVPAPTVMAGGLGSVNTSQYELITHDDAARTDKPPYRVPSMIEIAAVPPNGYKAISTFSGCGGSCLGFEMAGYEVLWANEFIPAAQEVYRLNHPQVILDDRDIRQVKPAAVLRATGLKAGQLDVLEGSPPCASFSTAGKRSQSWGEVKPYSDTKQRTDDLFWEYARLLRGLQPKTFVAENVSGLVKGVAKGYFLDILTELRACGYVVTARLLDAKWLGVPQTRQRIIFIGVRGDLAAKYDLVPAFPAPLPYFYSIADALPALRVKYVRHGPNSFDVPADALNIPALTVGADPSGGAWSRHEVTVEGRLNHSFGAGTRSLDRAAPTIEAGDLTQLRLASDPPSGWQGAKDGEGRAVSSTDPSPTILTHGRGFNGVIITVDPRGQHAVQRRNGQQPAPTIKAQNSQHYSIERPDEELIDQGTDVMLAGCLKAEWEQTRRGQNSGKYFNLTKPELDGAVPTVSAIGGQGGGRATASVVHPTEKRKFLISELKRICAFPDDFQLTGTYAQQWERLGRSVPPVMMRHIAETIKVEILDKLAAAEKSARRGRGSARSSARSSRRKSAARR